MTKNVMSYADVKLTGYLLENKYPQSFRLVRYYDKEEDLESTFLMDETYISTLDIINLYKKR